MSAWNFGASILTFAFPMALFFLVAGALYVAYTKPEVSPGHWVGTAGPSVAYTRTFTPRAPAASPPAATATPETQATGATEGQGAGAAGGPVTGGPVTEDAATEGPATEGSAPATEDGQAGTGDGA